MRWFNSFTHKILADKRLLALVALISLLVYPLKQWTTARICEEKRSSEFLATKKESNRLTTGIYFRVVCD